MWLMGVVLEQLLSQSSNAESLPSVGVSGASALVGPRWNPKLPGDVRLGGSAKNKEKALDLVPLQKFLKGMVKLVAQQKFQKGTLDLVAVQNKKRH